ncbi:ferritin heavy chain-like isoform X1 [Monodelphis domestica]|uniref:Ferritin n=1 Tax=Monodelphis domestica TaxID=13616 RepID=A0A5F8HBU8_MONDO|nr:ferritin heavy chain-like isoform X1 [Monodelphis domestica]
MAAEAVTLTISRFLGRSLRAGRGLPVVARCFGGQIKPTGEKITGSGQVCDEENYRRIHVVSRQKQFFLWRWTYPSHSSSHISVAVYNVLHSAQFHRPGAITAANGWPPPPQLSFFTTSSSASAETPSSTSQVRQNFHQGSEAAINKQINLELYASYVYLSMAYYFDRDDVALKNFSKYFLHQAQEERKHAEKLMKFQNQRGGRIFFQDIKKPDRDDWESGLKAMECALNLEKNVNESLLELHKLAGAEKDPHLCDFIETHYLDEQVKSIKQIGEHVTNLRKMGAPDSGIAEYLFDKHTLGDSDNET